MVKEATMQRFNLVLLPEKTELQALFSRLALSYFKDYQDGYILADGALAHVTLCAFRAVREQDARSVFRSFQAERNITLGIEQFHLRAGTDEHQGFFWAEYLMEKKQTLLAMQKNCFHHLASKGCEVLTPVDGYAPHITLARIPFLLSELPSVDEVEGKAISFRPAVGLSTENGLLLREL